MSFSLASTGLTCNPAASSRAWRREISIGSVTATSKFRPSISIGTMRACLNNAPHVIELRGRYFQDVAFLKARHSVLHPGNNMKAITWLELELCSLAFQFYLQLQAST